MLRGFGGLELRLAVGIETGDSGVAGRGGGVVEKDKVPGTRGTKDVASGDRVDGACAPVATGAVMAAVERDL